MSQKHTCYLPDVNKTSVVKHIKIATVCVTWRKCLFYFFISLKSRYRIYEHERLKIVIMKVLDLMRWFLTFPFDFLGCPFRVESLWRERRTNYFKSMWRSIVWKISATQPGSWYGQWQVLLGRYSQCYWENGAICNRCFIMWLKN